jgi:hypothetical protein
MQVVASPLKTKKWRAIFTDGSHTDFGDPNYEDYTQHKDEKRRELYKQRHKKDLRTNNPRKAGFLSYYILWGESKSLEQNIRDYKMMFKDKL